MNRKPKPTIERIKLTLEQSEMVEQLKQGYYMYYRHGELRRKQTLTPEGITNQLKKIFGGLCFCAQAPTFIVKYDYDGATRIERYCDSCLEKAKAQGDLF